MSNARQLVQLVLDAFQRQLLELRLQLGEQQLRARQQLLLVVLLTA